MGHDSAGLQVSLFAPMARQGLPHTHTPTKQMLGAEALPSGTTRHRKDFMKGEDRRVGVGEELCHKARAQVS